MHTMGSEEFTKLAVPRGDINAAIVAISSDIFQDPSDGGLYLRGTRKKLLNILLMENELLALLKFLRFPYKALVLLPEEYLLSMAI